MSQKKTWALIGSSRGLGRAVFEEALARDPSRDFFLAARKIQLLEGLKAKGENVKVAAIDLSRADERSKLWQLLGQVQAERIFYFAGGGPFGFFESKALRDHRWALETSFLAPMELLHHVLQDYKSLKQVVVVGSAIAEDQADPKAASYSAAKHALLGLMKSLWAEQKLRSPQVDLRLFSPGYMDTELLPAGATPRQGRLDSPRDVACQLLDWCLDPEGAAHYK